VREFKLVNLPYDKDLLARYQELSKLPGFVFLDSSDKTKGRYDILSALPYEQIKLYRQSGCITQVFKQLQALILPTNFALDLPFQGGAIGYFSYDFAAILAGITSLPQPTLAAMPLVDLGLYDWALISDHLQKKVTLFAANSQPQTAGIIEEVIALWHKSHNKPDSFSLSESFTPLISKADYQKAFQAIYQDLQRGRSYQINYTQPFNAHYQGDPWTMYRRVRANNPVPYSAFLRTSDADILSFSPERFLMMDKGYLLTSPIKGTARRSTNYQEDIDLANRLLSSDKNRAENVMIVDLLRNDLGKIAKPGSVYVRSLCALESYQSVHHLVSHIEAFCLENSSPVDVFSACFPGGSITGAPKLEAMRIIAEQEAYARGLYCGSIGYFSKHGRFDSNIAIRTVIARNNTLHLAAGGGIVIDSNWEEEYFECFSKIAAIVNGSGVRAKV
jgi:para-aminobenzoate synthetase component I